MISKIIKMNTISFENILHTISTHKFDESMIEEYNNQQDSIASFIFENFLTSLFKDIKNISNDNINIILARFNKFIDLFNLNISNYDFDNLSKKCCCYYLFDVYNNKNFYNLKEIYNTIKHEGDNLKNLISYIWNEQSILNIYSMKNENDSNLIISKDNTLNNNENYNLIYDFIINIFMYNIHTILPNFINTIGISINPSKYYIKKVDNSKTINYDEYYIYNNLKDQYIILYDSDMDFNYIEYIFEKEEDSLSRFVNTFLQIYRALYVANNIFNFTHGNLICNNIFIKSIKTKINIQECDEFLEIGKKYGYNYKYHEIEDIVMITNFNNSKINIKKDGTDYKLKKISSNIGSIYTMSQDILLLLINIFLESKKFNNNEIYNLIYYILSKYFEEPKDIVKLIYMPYNVYNKKDQPVFSFKNVSNLDILEYFYEYMNIKNIDISNNFKNKNNTPIYPNEINITSFFKYNNINLYNSILSDKKINNNFIVKIHTKEYENLKIKIIDINKNIKIYEYLKLTLESSGLNDSIYEEISILSDLIIEYFKNLKLFIYYSYSIYNKIKEDDISKISMSDHTLSTLYYIYFTLDKEVWSGNSNILSLFKIFEYSLKDDMLSYIFSMLD